MSNQSAAFRVRTGVHENNPPLDLEAAPANVVRVINDSTREIDRTTARVQAVRAAGLEPLPCFKTHTYGTDADFEANFRRYIDGIEGSARWVEVGNEPPELDSYLRRLAVASPIARAAGLQVILSAFVGWSGGFPAAAAALDGGRIAEWRHVDHVATHPYAYTAEEVEVRLQDLRQRLDSRAAARAKHLFVTEVGWPVFTGRFLQRSMIWTPAGQADQLSALLARLLPLGGALKLRLVGVFCHRDYGAADATHWGPWCGLVDRSGTARPALSVLAGTPRFTAWSPSDPLVGQ